MTHSYDPPTSWRDQRICRTCRRSARRRVDPEDRITAFTIQNGRSNIYHSGGEYGITDCGRDATAEHYRWPL